MERVGNPDRIYMSTGMAKKMFTCIFKGVPSLCHKSCKMMCEISTSQVHSLDGMRQRITFIYGDYMRHSIPRIEHNTCSSARCIQGEHSLDGHIHGRAIESLKHDLEKKAAVQEDVYMWLFSVTP